MGNYESASSSDEDMEENIKTQKEEAIALNSTWG
jgi:hypothetical protein